MQKIKDNGRTLMTKKTTAKETTVDQQSSQIGTAKQREDTSDYKPNNKNYKEL